ncbi:divalent metal cation transporter MntH [mine drainage metagenome]|uniref:Divalent metal cation transporter MntH n=1 Tax=mine drainage metagenome TaxID=410659 RepID=A0A1J5S385_9ZZZZ
MSSSSIAVSLDQRTRLAALQSLQTPSRRGGPWLPFVGPAVLASVAYIDPGNFATNLQAGSTLGYTLLWVVLWANLMAMLVQTLSAKLGIATGRNMPELIRERWPRPLARLYWVQAEIVAMFTDLAEFLGAALGFHLLGGFSMPVSVLLTFAVVMAILGLERRGFRPLEIAVGALVAVITVAYGLELALSHIDWASAVRGLVLPSWGAGDDGLYLAAGILGATVMPHVIYLHSSLTQRRVLVPDALKPRLMRATRREVMLAMGLAGLLNMAMLAAAAATFQGRGAAMADLSVAWQSLTPLLGPAAAALFAVALLASGLSSSVVGTLSGQVVMQGFVGFSIPLWLRRTLTTLPAVVVIALGMDTTKVLVFSQVVLSFGIPFALVPLLLFTGQRELMGELVNAPRVRLAGWLIVSIIIALNLWLLGAMV